MDVLTLFQDSRSHSNIRGGGGGGGGGGGEGLSLYHCTVSYHYQIRGVHIGKDLVYTPSENKVIL